MARDHRPDLALTMKNSSQDDMKKYIENLLEGKPIQRQVYTGTQREALLMPWINQHDLCKTEPLLLMINARARHPPHAFANRDLQSATFDLAQTEWRALEGYVMHFNGQSSPETYGQLRKGEWRAKFGSHLGGDPRFACGSINPGDGLWVLEIQDRVYAFLVQAAQRILHDIPAADLTGAQYIVQPEPPLPSANARDDGVVSLATTNLETSYSAPGRMDLDRLQSLLIAKAREAEDDLWALREDPARFIESLEDFLAHKPQYLNDLSGRQHASTTRQGFANTFGAMAPPGMDNLRSLQVMEFLLSRFTEAEFWAELAQDASDVATLKERHFDGRDMQHSDTLQEPFATALYTFVAGIADAVKARINILRMEVWASPPLRPFMQRSSPDTLDDCVSNSTQDPPPHIFEFMTILGRLFDEKDREMLGHLASTQSMLEQYDYFISNTPDAPKAVSPLVAQEISNLSLLAECLRQIQLFQPWVASFDREMERPPVQAAIDAILSKRRAVYLPLQRFMFQPNSQIWTTADAMSHRPYPVQKKRTAQNIEAMQQAEQMLDDLWKTMLAALVKQKALLPHCRRVLISEGRQLHRTPAWVEPAKPVKNVNAVSEAFSSITLKPATDSMKAEIQPVRTKAKTRGTPKPDLTDGQIEPSAAAATAAGDDTGTSIIKVDKRSLKVFSVLFHTPSSSALPGEVPWSEFLHAMHCAGFSLEKLYGSIWQFTPGNGTDASLRSILFHQPHPHPKIPFHHARRHGRRLQRAYGWSYDTFDTE